MFKAIRLASAGEARGCRIQRGGRHPVAAVLLCGILMPVLSHAQTVPGAGTLLQQIEPPPHEALPPKAEPLFLPPPVLTSFVSATIVVRDFSLSRPGKLDLGGCVFEGSHIFRRQIDFGRS